MVPENDFALALRSPRDLVQRLYEKWGSSEKAAASFSCSVEKEFRGIFDGPELLQKIPSINPKTVTSLLEGGSSSGRLVRLRCMLQDTGLGTEIFPQSLASESGPAVHCGSYGAEDRGGDFGDLNRSGYRDLEERSCMYAVSVPGETSWAAARREGDEALQPCGDAVLSDALARLSVSSTSTKANGVIQDKIPAPELPHVGAVVKFYSLEQADKLQVANVIEVVGILDQCTIPNGEWDGAAAGSDGAQTPAQPLLPCVHVIFFDPVRSSTLLRKHTVAAAASDVRSALIGHLASALDGDELAAEFTLLSLCSQIHTRRPGLLLGAFTLNLTNFPLAADAKETTGTSNTPAEVLSATLSTFIPSLVRQSMGLSHLNDTHTRMAPLNAGDTLRAGRLQLPKGTCVVVDETQMGEGQLNENGMRNVQTLSHTVQHQTLAYRFPFSDFEFDVDLNFLILSQGKSLLPATMHLPIERSRAPDSPTVTPSASQFDSYRDLILSARAVPSFSIPEAVSEHIQAEFVKLRRQEDPGVREGQQDLVRRMAIARLVALSHGRAELDEQTWKEAVQLDERRRLRVEDHAVPSKPRATLM